MVQIRSILLYSHRLLQILHIHSREGPLGGEFFDFFPQLLDHLGTFFALFFSRSGSNKVFQELAAGFLLDPQGKLDGAVQELGNDLDVRFEHVA